MKNKGTKVIIGILLVLALAFTSTVQMPISQVQAASKATLNKTKVTMHKNSTYQL